LYAEIPGLCHLIRLDQQFAFDPCLTCTPCVPLAQTARRDQSDSGSGLTTNRANQTTPRDSNFAFNVSCSPQPAARYRPSSSLCNRLVWMSPSASDRLASTGLSKTAVFDVDENLRSHRCCMGLRPLQRLPRTAVLRNEGCRPQFQQDCGPAECQHCRAGVQPFGFACLRRVLDGWYWRLPPRPRLR